jgi:hypothetical protein
VARHSARTDASPDRDDVELSPPVPPDVRRSARLLQLLVVGLLLIAAGVVGALGGFARGPVKGLPDVQVDQPIDAGSWRVTVHSAAAGTELHGTRAKDGTYLIQVEATILVTDSRTRSLFLVDPVHHAVLELDGVPGVQTESPDLTSVRDDRLASYLQPGLPERIAFGWEVASTTPVPKQLRVIVVGEHARPSSFFFLGSTEYDLSLRASVTVPVSNAVSQ